MHLVGFYYKTVQKLEMHIVCPAHTSCNSYGFTNREKGGHVPQ